jgi:hypothetical protein
MSENLIRRLWRKLVAAWRASNTARPPAPRSESELRRLRRDREKPFPMF